MDGEPDRHGEVGQPEQDVHPPKAVDEADGLRLGHNRDLPHRLRRRNLLRFGEQVDVQVIGSGTDGELTPERVAAYLVKYATKSAEDFGLGERRLSGLARSGIGVSAHVARIVRTAWDLGAVEELAGLRRWLHMLGFRGH